MSVLRAILAARAAGVRFGVDGSDIVLDAPAPPPPEVIDALARHKPAILAALRGAAAREVPSEWIRGVARLDPDQPVGDTPLPRWRQFVEDARSFVRGPFAPVAAAIGWSVGDVFGCDPVRPYARIDQMGLIWLIGEGELLALSSAIAIIRTPTGARQTYRRRRSPDPARVPAWELASGGGTPRAA